MALGRSLSSRRRQRNHSVLTRSRRLAFEPLEDRRMLATITVTSLADNLDVDGQVTLREAILAAEMDISVDGSIAGNGADTIVFHPSLSGTVHLSLVGDLSDGPSALAITTPITIQGNANGITIALSEMAEPMRLFHVGPTGSLTLDSISLTGGDYRAASGTTDQPNGSDGRGGAILNQGSLEIVASTLFGNQAMGGTPAPGGNPGRGLGGAVYNDGGDVSIRNATLSQNAVYNGSGDALSHAFGGGVYSRNGSLAIYHSTLVDNTATAGRGAYSIADGDGSTATLQIHHSIVGHDRPSEVITDVVATLTNDGTSVASGSYNFIRQDIGVTSTPVARAAPLLGPLADNGGPTWTHALLPGSPAVNWGDPAAVPGLAGVPLFDQRGPGFSRVTDGDSLGGARIDVGAFERQAELADPALPGDYNQNGVVDAADYTTWRDHYGAAVAPYSGADGDGSGVIDDADYAVWRAAFGQSSAVPVSALTADSAVATAASPAGIHGDARFFSNPISTDPERPLAPSISNLSVDARDLALLALVADGGAAVESFHVTDASEPVAEGETAGWEHELAFEELSMRISIA